MTAEEYHAVKACSSSLLRACNPPARAKHLLDNPIVPTEAMRLGTDIHSYVMQPKVKVLDKIAVRPDGMDFRTKEGKAWKEQQIAFGNRVESAEYVQAIIRCHATILANRTAFRLINDSSPEQTFFWKEGGLDCKAMLDLSGGTVIADIKSLSEGLASPNRFHKIAYDRGLHIQAAWYLHAAQIHGLPADKFIFIAVETVPPYLCAVYECSDDFLYLGKLEIEMRLPMIQRGFANGEWPGYGENVKLLTLPKYFDEITGESDGDVMPWD